MSTASYKLKVVFAGPCKTGKTSIANFLADATEVSGSESDYWPTHVVRILEFEQKVNVLNRYVNVEVELWDTSGNLKFQSHWPALSNDANGVVFVFNPDDENTARHLDTYHSGFPVNESCSIVFAHDKSGGPTGKAEGAQLSNRFSRIPQLDVNTEEGGGSLRSDFATFLSNLVTASSAKRDQEEMHIINR